MTNDRSATNNLQTQLDELQAENLHLRQQVAELHQNQERLHYALEGSSVGLWDWLIPENEAVLSDRYREMLSYSREELPDSLDSWLNNIHPDDMPGVTQTLEDYLGGQREEYLVEHRLRHKSGEWRWMLSRGKVVVRDEDGQPLRMTGTVTDITERKKQEEELSTNQELLRNVIDHSPAIIYVKDQEGCYRLVNRQFSQMPLIRHLDTVIGKTDADFMPPEIAAIIAQNDQDIIAQGHAVQLDEDVPQEDGMHSYIATKFPMYDAAGRYIGLGGISTDITERKRQEEEVRIFKTMADTAPDGFGMADANGTLTYANAAYRALTGYGDALVGMNFLDHFTEEDRAVALEALTRTATQGDWQGVLNFQRQDGSIIPVDSKGFVTRDEEGNIAAVMGLFRDMSEQSQVEAERAALQQKVIDAQRDALRELSTPLIPISDKVVIMPLIGTIDSQRAQQVMETLLEGVAQHRASLAILDITGVSMVDTQVAQAFIQAAQAVKLLGAQVMLTGIQPQIAQTLVHLGIDLSGIQTQSSLQAGIAAAL